MYAQRQKVQSEPSFHLQDNRPDEPASPLGQIHDLYGNAELAAILGLSFPVPVIPAPPPPPVPVKIEDDPELAAWRAFFARRAA